MEMHATGDGNITGKYQTAVGRADGQYELLGRHTCNANDGTTVAFSVAWDKPTRPTNSTTAWSGTLRGNEIHTSWLLTTFMKPEDEWSSVRVGKDTFKKTT